MAEEMSDLLRVLSLTLDVMEKELLVISIDQGIPSNADTDLTTRNYDKIPEDVKLRWNDLRTIIGDTKYKIRKTKKRFTGQQDDSYGGTRESHESYGSIVLSNPTGGTGNMFGSSIRHMHYVSIEIHRATLYRSLHEDGIHPDETLIRINMSHEQWGRFISGAGRGQGTPCTISRFENRSIESPKFINKRAVFKHEFTTVMEELGNKLRLLEDGAVAKLKSKGTINKGDRDKIANQINMLIQEVHSNIPFAIDQFDETMENITEAAKNEVETFMQNIARETGIKELSSQDGITSLVNKASDVLNLDDGGE